MHKDRAAQTLNCNEKACTLFASLQLKKIHALILKWEKSTTFYTRIQQQFIDALNECQALLQ